MNALYGYIYADVRRPHRLARRARSVAEHNSEAPQGAIREHLRPNACPTLPNSGVLCLSDRSTML